MNKLNKAIVVGASVATIGGVGLGTTTLATNGGSSWWGHYSNNKDDAFDAELSTELSAKFNLTETEVATAIEAVRDNQYNILDENRQERLRKALDNEKLTQEQYDTVIEKLTGIDALYDQVDDLEGDERRGLQSQIKGEFKDLKEWMEDEDLSWQILGFSDRWDKGHHYKSHDRR